MSLTTPPPLPFHVGGLSRVRLLQPARFATTSCSGLPYPLNDCDGIQNKRAKMDPDKAVTSLDLQRQQAAAKAAGRTSDAAGDAANAATDGAAAPADDSRQNGAGPPRQQPALRLNVAGASPPCVHHRGCRSPPTAAVGFAPVLAHRVIDGAGSRQTVRCVPATCMQVASWSWPISARSQSATRLLAIAPASAHLFAQRWRRRRRS